MVSESHGRRAQDAYFLTSFEAYPTPFLSLGIRALSLLTVCIVFYWNCLLMSLSHPLDCEILGILNPEP